MANARPFSWWTALAGALEMFLEPGRGSWSRIRAARGHRGAHARAFGNRAAISRL